MQAAGERVARCKPVSHGRRVCPKVGWLAADTHVRARRKYAANTKGGKHSRPWNEIEAPNTGGSIPVNRTSKWHFALAYPPKQTRHAAPHPKRPP